MKINLSLLTIAAVFLSVIGKQEIILPLNPSDLISDLRVKISTDSIYLDVIGSTPQRQTVRIFNGTGCKLEWLIGAGSLANETDYYKKFIISFEDRTFASILHSPIKCNWKHILKPLSNSSCFYDISWKKEEPGSFPFELKCCETVCKGSINSSSNGGKKMDYFIIILSLILVVFIPKKWS